MSDLESSNNLNKRMGLIGIELLTMAAFCAVAIGLVAGMAALLFQFD